MPELLYELLPKLRDKHGLSIPELARRTVRMGIHEIPQKSIEALESPRRAGQIPKAHTLEALAAALGEDVTVFYEWPIAAAQAARVPTPSVADRARKAAQRLDGTQPTSRRTPDAEGDAGASR